MIIVYIKTSKTSNIFHTIFNKFTTQNIEGKQIIYVPINKNTKAKKTEKVIDKLCKYLYNNNITTCVLDKELMTNETAKNELYYNNINILDGKKLDRFLLCNLIEKIYKLKNKQIETGEITLLINENDDTNTENIKRIAEKVKRLNIVTSNIKLFNRIVDNVYEELGILIKLTNNMKTNLKKSDIIINIDFPEEQINRLNIPNNATILNIPRNISINAKKFLGINIKTWEIKIPDKYKSQDFLDTSMYEAQIYSKPNFQIFKQIQNDKIQIGNLIGKNGIINNKEFD